MDILTDYSGRQCDGISRRNLLRIGGCGLASCLGGHWMTWPAMANSPGSPIRDKSIVLVFLGGGPSQHETFDPKPEGQDSSTSIAGHIGTRLPGVRFASYFPLLAERAERLTIVRSFQTNHAEHNGAHKQLMTGDLTVQDGKPIAEPGLGAVCSRIIGPIDQTTGMPTHALIPPTTKYLNKAEGFAGAYESIIEGAQPAWLGVKYAPFQTKVEMAEGKPRQGKHEEINPLLDDLEPRVPDWKLDARFDLLNQLDHFNRQADLSGVMDGMDHYSRQAVELIRNGSVRKALDLSQEAPRTLAAYDTEHFRNWRCTENSRFNRNSPSIGISLGRQMLLARRLCEAGCRFVTVIHANWDFHARPGIPNIPEGMGVLAPPLDHALAAFLDDIRQRGLDDKILLVVTGEFGRTPKLDNNLGRHHWPRLCPLVFAGGGFHHGQVIGESDNRGGEPAGDPITIADLHSTVMHALFDVSRLRLDPSIPGKLLERAQQGQPIKGLF